ncbi:atherin-like [Equus asinus]|uniref:atherin-like n=1 Tax=Equus asinus TaxID=9793 RepID=UPI0038F68E8F
MQETAQPRGRWSEGPRGSAEAPGVARRGAGGDAAPRLPPGLRRVQPPHPAPPPPRLPASASASTPPAAAPPALAAAPPFAPPAARGRLRAAPRGAGLPPVTARPPPPAAAAAAAQVCGDLPGRAASSRSVRVRVLAHGRRPRPPAARAPRAARPAPRPPGPVSARSGRRPRHGALRMRRGAGAGLRARSGVVSAAPRAPARPPPARAPRRGHAVAHLAGDQGDPGGSVHLRHPPHPVRDPLVHLPRCGLRPRHLSAAGPGDHRAEDAPRAGHGGWAARRRSPPPAPGPTARSPPPPGLDLQGRTGESG